MNASNHGNSRESNSYTITCTLLVGVCMSLAVVLGLRGTPQYLELPVILLGIFFLAMGFVAIVIAFTMKAMTGVLQFLTGLALVVSAAYLLSVM